jgi:hypothetical protein
MTNNASRQIVFNSLEAAFVHISTARRATEKSSGGAARERFQELSSSSGSILKAGHGSNDPVPRYMLDEVEYIRMFGW